MEGGGAYPSGDQQEARSPGARRVKAVPQGPERPQPLAVGVLELWASLAVRNYRTGARYTMIVIGILSLLNFPLGTALGILCIWALIADRDTVARFRGERPPTPGTTRTYAGGQRPV